MKKTFSSHLMVLLAAILLAACSNEPKPEDIQREATDLLTLAEAQLGLTKESAVANLLEAKYEKDAHVDSIFWAKTSEDGYIVLTCVDDTVVMVDAAKEHSSMENAQLTAEIFSRYGYRNALPDVQLWGGMTVHGDSTYYVDGSLVPTLSVLMTGMVMMNILPKEIAQFFTTATKKNHGLYYEDCRADAKVLTYTMEGGAYTSSWVELVKETSQIDWTQVLQDNPLIGPKHFSFYSVETSIHAKDAKHSSYRCTYRHASDIVYDPSDGLNFPGAPDISFF